MSLLEEIKSYKQPELQTVVKTNVETVSILGLKDIFDKNLYLEKLDETSPLYSPDKPFEQYELYHIEENDGQITKTSYVVETPEDSPYVEITDYYREYLATGKITLPDIINATHELPIPVYTLGTFGTKMVPTVKLKNGYRAVIVDGTIITGCKLT